MPTILAKNMFFDLLYGFLVRKDINSFTDLYRKYIAEESLDSNEEFKGELIAHLLVRFSKDYSTSNHPIQFIKLSDFNDMLLSFIVNADYYGREEHETDKYYLITDIVINNKLDILDSMDTSDAVEIILMTLDMIYSYYDKSFLFCSPLQINAKNLKKFASNHDSYETIGLFNVVDAAEWLVNYLKTQNRYLYVIVDDLLESKFEKYDIEYMSIPDDLRCESVFEAVQKTLAQKFLDITNTCLASVPKYYLNNSYYSDLIVEDAYHRGYKIYFDYKLDKLIKENPAIEECIQSEIEDYLWFYNDEFRAINRYINLKFYEDTNDETVQQEIEEILEEYPEFEDKTEDELYEKQASIYVWALDDFLSNHNYVLNFLDDKGLISVLEIDENCEMSKFIQDALYDSILDDYSEAFEQIQELLNHKFDNNELFALLYFLDPDFKSSFAVSEYYHPLDKPLVIKLE